MYSVTRLATISYAGRAFGYESAGDLSTKIKRKLDGIVPDPILPVIDQLMSAS